MPYDILIFLTSKPGLSPAEFKEGYESHVRLLQHYAAHTFPKLHRRYYVKSGADNLPTILRGNKAFFDFDAVAEVGFEDEAAYRAFIQSLSGEEATAKLAEDEKRFADMEQMRVLVIGDIQETRGGDA